MTEDLPEDATLRWWLTRVWVPGLLVGAGVAAAVRWLVG